MTLRMRVSGVYKKCKLRVSADGAPVAERNRPIVAPGEMETLELNAEQSRRLRSAECVEITLTNKDG